MDRTKNLTAINEYLDSKGIFNERSQSIKTTVEAFKNGISVFKDSEIEISFNMNKYDAKELSFMDIEYTQLHEVLNKHRSVNHHFQCFSFEADRLIVTDPQDKSMKIVIY